MKPLRVLRLSGAPDALPQPTRPACRPHRISLITDHEWVPAHADLNWADLTRLECWILDWEDHGLAPRGLDAATLWVSSLTVPPIAERVYREAAS